MAKDFELIQGTALNSMTKETIKNLCKKHKLYATPKLNDVLYLHYQGFQKIEFLDEYIGLKCLWLDCNAISQISGLQNQEELRCLYLHNNFIKKIENLECCKKLDTLNLSHNYIKTIENCDYSVLPVLNTLNLSHNSLNSIACLEGLVKCKSLSILDLSHNRIEDILLVKILSQMPELRVLTLTGNPVINEIPAYRKTLIVDCKKLTYLDTRPVFDRDRSCAEAWKRGGFEEEKREHEKWIKAKQQRILNSVKATLKLKQRNGTEDDYLAENLKFKSDVGNDVNDDICRKNGENSVPDMEIDVHNQLSQKYAEMIESDCSGGQQESAGNCTIRIAKSHSIELSTVEHVIYANETPINKTLEELSENSNYKWAKESAASDKPLIEVLHQDEPNVNAMFMDTDSENNSAFTSSAIESNLSVIFHCENLDTLKYLNIDYEGTDGSIMCSDSEVEEASTISQPENKNQ